MTTSPRAVRAVFRPSSIAHKLTRILLVAVITALSLVGPQMATASAGGFDCKDAPRPEFPNGTQQSVFDPRSGDADNHSRPPAGDPPSGYETYGWAGLRWYTYDLGCGSDLVRAPEAVADTKLGNIFLTVGENLTAAAIWLDQQANTPDEAATNGNGSSWTSFDKIVTSVSTGLKAGVYTPWVGLALMIAAVIIGYRAFKQDSAAVTRMLMLAGTAFLLGGLFVGAPQKAIKVSDETFSQMITGTQQEVFNSLGLPSRPRDVIIDRILIPDIQKGWFGANYDDDTAKLWPDLRDSMAFTYEEQKKFANDNKGANSASEGAKKDNFTKVIDELSKNDLSYQVFQGKDSHRTSTGFLAMMKSGLPSILWMGGSLLKIAALLAIRFAILFAPIWVPLTFVSGGLLERIGRALFSAYLWGIAGAIVVAVYLATLVRVYTTADIDGAWRLWLMVLLSIIGWKILRPFKRISQMMRQDSSSMLGRGRQHGKSLGQRAWRGLSWAGGPAQAVGDSIGDSIGEESGRKSGLSDGTGYTPTASATPRRPEGQDFDRFRNRNAQENKWRAESLSDTSPWDKKNSTRSDLYNDPAEGRRPITVDGEVVSSSMITTPRDDLTSPSLGRNPSPASEDPAAASGDVAAVGAPAPIPAVWNGGPSSPIAPTRLYRAAPPPQRALVVAGGGAHRADVAPQRRIWDNPTLDSSTRHGGIDD